ncbi:conserved hypothetical protein [Perkinsus marinus ATCC 50983]|uniref:RNA methyltransferase n=1 Tax=Perkinsus marinus (strain ATCC 50983 / TXsc) TaxID=423536 RepID=C5KGT0_PERM5|nr:conserved hypothetical protein [Perkinsus marinus ATCC 50983]EER16348.1 conserved hypothetical protein [Perkinsus marinus ATCC 50983]|eukprot:XP_002784552.1 conserved hypothetical protein [Perkinsus marinus ATCC 50983]
MEFHHPSDMKNTNFPPIATTDTSVDFQASTLACKRPREENQDVSADLKRQRLGYPTAREEANDNIFTDIPLQGTPSVAAEFMPEKQPLLPPPVFRSKRSIFEYGNYDKYYNYRHETQAFVDARLSAIMQYLGGDQLDFFHDKTVLDIGCNIGFISFYVAYILGAKRVVGIDIDHTLIDQALRQLRKYKHDGFPINEEEIERISDRFPFNIEFRTEDFSKDTVDIDVKDGSVITVATPCSYEEEKYDVIFLLSVIKWIHYHHGDDGVKHAFSKIYRLLKPGGLFIFEPQDWKSYRKKRNLTREIRANYNSIEFRPTQFVDYLEKEVGFVLECTLKPSAATVTCDIRGFDRPVHILRKPVGKEEKKSSKYEKRIVNCMLRLNVNSLINIRLCEDEKTSFFMPGKRGCKRR